MLDELQVWRNILHAENGNRFITKEKSLGILHLDFALFPLAMNTIVLKHVSLEIKQEN